MKTAIIVVLVILVAAIALLVRRRRALRPEFAVGDWVYVIEPGATHGEFYRVTAVTPTGVEVDNP